MAADGTESQSGERFANDIQTFRVIVMNYIKYLADLST